MIKVGDKVKVLEDYNFNMALVTKINRTTIKIRDVFDNEYNVKKEKVAELNEKVVIVWERWKGVNGRGSHRIERVLYPEHRRPAKDIPRQVNRLWESSYGVMERIM